MNEPAAVSDRSCLDCGTPLRPEQNFCYHCAQRADVKRLTIHAIGHDFLHAVFHADRSVFSLLKALLILPGHVAREYVAGMRRRHFGPFATLIILMGIAAVLLDVTGFQSFTRPTGVPLNGLLNFLQLHTHEGCDFCGGHHLDDEDELTRVSNAVVDLVHEGKLDQAEATARDLLERHPEVHDGYDRLGMVYEARGQNKQAADCYRKVIEFARQHPEQYDPEFQKAFQGWVEELDPPAAT